MAEIHSIGNSSGYYLMKVAAAVREAEDAGFIVTVERQPLKPLAMGHAQTILEIRPVRDLSVQRERLWAAELGARRPRLARMADPRGVGLVEQHVGSGLIEQPLGSGPSIETAESEFHAPQPQIDWSGRS